MWQREIFIGMKLKKKLNSYNSFINPNKLNIEL